MFKMEIVETAAGKLVRLNVDGTLSEISANLTRCVVALRNSIKENDFVSGVLFDYFLRDAFVDAILQDSFEEAHKVVGEKADRLKAEMEVSISGEGNEC